MKRTLTVLAAAATAALLAGCGTSGHTTPAPAPAPSAVQSFTPPPSAPPQQPSPATAAGWAAKWCQAQPGMTRDALLGLMGTPTDQFADQASWNAYEWQFNAYFSSGGTVRQLDINDVDLTQAEKAGLGCATTRPAQ